jgi:hypothetical protein
MRPHQYRRFHKRPASAAQALAAIAPGVVIMLKRHIQQPFQHLRLLRAGYGLLSCDDKAGHAIDPQPMRAEVFGMHRLSLLTGTKEGQRRMRVKADPPSHSRKPAGIANIHTIGEIGIKQRFHHHLAQAFPHRITHQAMRIDAGWHTPHQVKAKTDSLGSAKIHQRILQAPRAILTTEFPRDEFCAGNAAWGNVSSGMISGLARKARRSRLTPR